MYLSDIVRRSGRSLKSAKARTLLTALAIAVGTFALTLTLAASNGAQAFVNQIIADNFDPAELIVAKDEAVFGRGDTSKPREYNESFGEAASNAGAPIQVEQITDEDIAKIKAVGGIDQIREGINLNLQYLTRKDQKKFIGAVGVFSSYQKPELVAGNIPKPLASKQVLLPEAYVSALGFKDAQSAVGQEIILAVRKPVDAATIQSLARSGSLSDQAQLNSLTKESTVEEVFNIAAVLKKPTTSQPGTELYLYIGIEDARLLNDIATQGTSNYRKYQYINVRVSGGEDNEKLLAVQDKLKDMKFVAQSVEDTQKFLTQIISVLQGIVAAFGAIAVIASVFGIVNTMYISVLQRTREIGLMKALGMRKRDIGRLFRFEAAWIGFLGGVIGSLLAFLLGLLLNPWVSKQLELGDDRLLIFKPAQVIMLILALMVVATLAGLLPARKASKLDPIEALRTE